MLSLALLFTSLLAAFAAAQNSSSFDPNSVDLTYRNQWCNGELSSCPLLCGGQAATNINVCTGSSLQYQCICSNGSAPANIDQYQGTLPTFICEATFAQCRKANAGSQACKNCGTLSPKDVQAAATTTSSSAAGSSTGMSMTSTASAAGGSSTAKTGAAGRVEAVGGVAAGIVAALLL